MEQQKNIHNSRIPCQPNTHHWRTTTKMWLTRYYCHHMPIYVLYTLWMRLDLLVDSLSLSLYESQSNICVRVVDLSTSFQSVVFLVHSKNRFVCTLTDICLRNSISRLYAPTPHKTCSVYVFSFHRQLSALVAGCYFEMNCVYLNLVALTYPAQIKYNVVWIKN